MYTKYKYLLVVLLSISFIACDIDDSIEPNLPPVAELPALNTNGLDFSNYVAVGASFTAGFTDGALFIAGQQNSFPNILAQQFGTANFSQPLTSDNIGGLLFGGNLVQGPRLFFDGSGPAVLPASPTTEITAGTPGPYNNMGVPGAKSFHLLFDGYGNPGGLLTDPATANPYFVRMASAPNTTMLGDAMAQNPSFFTLSEIGGNDVLGYATSGGDGSNPITPSDGPPGVGFDQTFGFIVATLTSGGAKGVVTNVPYITDLPHFTTVPYNPLDPTNEDFGPQIPVLNGFYAQLNGAFDFLGYPERKVEFSSSAASAIVVHDEDLDDISVQLNAALQAGGVDALMASLLADQFKQSRQANAGDLLVLPSSSVIATLNQDRFNQLVGFGVDPATAGQLSLNGLTFPMEDKWVLLPSEQAEIKDATDDYNVTIGAIADANPNIALVDLNSILTEASTMGVQFDNFIHTTDLVVGGLVSLDGIHLTARGYAFMANKFLEAIDAEFGTNFIASGTTAKAVGYPTNYSPALQ